jgi:AcrR family transcriptional regulator
VTGGQRSDFDARLLTASIAVVQEHGLAGLTTARLAEALGGSRMTLHRRGITREAVIRRLAQLAVEEYQRSVWPALTGPGSAAQRLVQALEATCAVADQYAKLLVGLYADDGGIFHVTTSPSDDLDADQSALPTRDVFVDPLARLLRDGALDGTLTCDDPDETATVLFNQVGWTYLALRQGQGWSSVRAREAVVALATRAVQTSSRPERG